MTFHEFGHENEKTILMIHGLSMSWDMFIPVIDRLKHRYHVIAVAVPGHDFDEDDEFTSIEDIARRIEAWLSKKGLQEVDCLYGLSMGGGISIRMLADNQIHFKTAIIDAGITPYKFSRFITRILLLNDYCTTMIGRHCPSLLELVFPKDRYGENLEPLKQALKHLSRKTIWRAYDSTNNYSMPAEFPTLNTKIEYWYGADEKKDRKLDIEYVEKHIPGGRLVEIPNMMHGQFVCVEHEQFCKKLINIIG